VGVPRRRGPAFVRRRTPNYTWAGIVNAAPVAVAAGAKVLLGTFALSTAFDETVTRVRGRADWTGVSVAGALGMIVVSADAAAIGITAIPGPVSDIANDGWLLWVPFPDSTQQTFDSKAQRIVREGSVIAVVVENNHASTSMSIGLAMRVLGRFRS